MSHISCPFCSPAAERVRASNNLAIAIRDRFPVSPEHTLIIPRRHVARLAHITNDETASLWSLLVKVRAQIDVEFKPAGYNVGVNDGRAAGQTVMHLHVHLIPRFEGDTRDPRGGLRWAIPEKADYWTNW